MVFWAKADFLRFMRSEALKTTKKTTAKETPATVATDFVNKLTIAVESNTRNTEARPIGISCPRMVILGGTFQPLSPLYLKRRTSMERLLKVKLQITPKA